jgi:hypothetical protein
LSSQDAKSWKEKPGLGPTFHDEPLPQDKEEARAKNRAEAIGKQYLLAYRPDIMGSYCWLIVSGVQLSKTDFEARSHFHWGTLCRLELDRVINVFDVTTDEHIGLDNFLVENLRASARLLQSKKVKEKRSSTYFLAVIASMAAAGAFIAVYELNDAYLQTAEETVSNQKPTTELNGQAEGTKKKKPRDRKATNPNKRSSETLQIIISK